MPRQTHDICQLYLDGNVKESAALQLKLLEFINALFMDVNPIPVKEALNLMGMEVGECRMPPVSYTHLDVYKRQVLVVVPSVKS